MFSVFSSPFFIVEHTKNISSNESLEPFKIVSFTQVKFSHIHKHVSITHSKAISVSLLLVFVNL